jgi:hypothetical protein
MPLTVLTATLIVRLRRPSDAALDDMFDESALDRFAHAATDTVMRAVDRLDGIWATSAVVTTEADDIVQVACALLCEPTPNPHALLRRHVPRIASRVHALSCVVTDTTCRPLTFKEAAERVMWIEFAQKTLSSPLARKDPPNPLALAHANAATLTRWRAWRDQLTPRRALKTSRPRTRRGIRP